MRTEKEIKEMIQTLERFLDEAKYLKDYRMAEELRTRIKQLEWVLSD